MKSYKLSTTGLKAIERHFGGCDSEAQARCLKNGSFFRSLAIQEIEEKQQQAKIMVQLIHGDTVVCRFSSRSDRDNTEIYQRMETMIKIAADCLDDIGDLIGDICATYDFENADCMDDAEPVDDSEPEA